MPALPDYSIYREDPKYLLCQLSRGHQPCFTVKIDDNLIVHLIPDLNGSYINLVIDVEELTGESGWQHLAENTVNLGDFIEHGGIIS